MGITRRTFYKGKMNKSVDERILPDGEYRHAENVLVQNSENSDEGSVQNSFSNKKITNIVFGTNPITLGNFSCEKTDTFYWFVNSNTGAFLMEHNFINNTTNVVLKDTRPLNSRVLKLNNNFLITGINKIVTDDRNKDLFAWVDDNMEPCCINIERAKTYGENGFEKEDIYVIKKYPTYPLEVLPITINNSSNNLIEKFLTFSYRYKFLDGEYSAPSDFVNYQFIPKKFDLDFYTLDNKGMENSFNAIKISFNTGKRQVSDIQILMKESTSNNIYIIETFNKEKESWLDETTKNFIFTHNKKYTVLPEEEIYRTFDNVPLKAKAQTLIGNRLVYGNYVEGRDLVNDENEKINISFDLGLVNESVDDNEKFTNTFPSNNQIQFTNPDLFQLTKFKKLLFSFEIKEGINDAYANTFYYVLPQTYTNLVDVFSTPEFADFLEIINADFLASYTFDMPSGFVVNTDPEIVYSVVSGVPTFTVTPLLINEIIDPLNIDTINLKFKSDSYLILNDLRNTTSLKTNRDYQVALIYMDDFGRKTTALTCLNNSIFVPQNYSTFKNYLRIRINNEAPNWAKTFKFAIKTPKLDYQTIYVNTYYNEDFYVWAKLEAENKDKVKIGDVLIVKKAPEAINEPLKVKVLDIKFQDKDFITGNTDLNGNAIVEPAGTYMKIRPQGFSMDFDDYKIYQEQTSSVSRSRGVFPISYLDLFTTLTPTYSEISVPSGSTINIFLKSFFKYDAGWREIVFNKDYVAQINYDTLEDFLNANVINTNMYADDNFGDQPNYKDNVSLVRGDLTASPFGNTIFTPNPAGKLYMKVIGLEAGGTRNRGGYLEVKIVVRTTDGFYAFETEPLQSIETDIFYESEQVFDIIDGNHIGNNQTQDISINTPGIVDLNFFNCYSHGNGIESYRIRDAFNTNYLNVDLKPTAASIEPYKQIRRFADLTYSEPFVESSNINSLNEFNLSKANFKELDKNFGSIQKIFSRQNDLLVLQEEIASKILYGKDALYSGDGEVNITSIPSVLGTQILYNGNNGISKNPESFAVNKYQIYYANAKRGTVHRLSIDGDTEISNYGMTDYFRDLFTKKPYSKKLGGFDPYHKQFVLSVGEEPFVKNEVNCGNQISISELTETYSYSFKLNSFEGDIVLNYNITSGTANIIVQFDGDTTTENDLSGIGTITIPRTSLLEDMVYIQISPSEENESIDFNIIHNCPLGIDLTLTTIILSDNDDAGKTITNRHNWSNKPFFESEYLLTAGPITLFEIETGIEGVGKFPKRGNIVKLESYKSEMNSGRFMAAHGNRMGYLVTTNNYDASDIDTIISEATFITVSTEIISTNSFREFGNFLFNRTLPNERLYLIWDYTTKHYSSAYTAAYLH